MFQELGEGTDVIHGEARETFIGDACTLIESIGTGMAETTVNHVPAQKRHVMTMALMSSGFARTVVSRS